MIYYIEKDEAIKYLINTTLKSISIESMGFSDATSFFSQLTLKTPILLMIDLSLFTQSNLETLKQIVKTKKELPIIILSSKVDKETRLMATDLNVKSFLLKPFSIIEFITTVEKCIKSIDKHVYKLNNLSLDHFNRQVFIDQFKVDLTTKEFDILYFLIKYKGHTIGRDFLIREVWRDRIGLNSRSLDVHLSILRRKIQSSNIEVLTIHGVGYKIE